MGVLKEAYAKLCGMSDICVWLYVWMIKVYKMSSRGLLSSIFKTGRRATLQHYNFACPREVYYDVWYDDSTMHNYDVLILRLA